MNNKQLERKANNIASDTTDVITELINEIDRLESENESLDYKITELEDDKLRLEEEISMLEDMMKGMVAR
jgi:predicted RNase H-like nuclease (RuvC/YqgF family)